MKEDRPVLKIDPTKTDYILEGIAFLGLAAIWILPVLAIRSLPETIPIHFGVNGKPDGWGSKMSIFLLPAIVILIFSGLSILNRFPHKFNYLVKITSENALHQYKKATRVMRMVKTFVVLLFLSIEWQICNSAVTGKLGAWFLPSILIVSVLMPVTLAFALTTGKGSGKVK